MSTKNFEILKQDSSISRLSLVVDQLNEFYRANGEMTDIERCLEDYFLDEKLSIILLDKFNMKVLNVLNVNFTKENLQIVIDNIKLCDDFSQLLFSVKNFSCSRFYAFMYGGEDIAARYVSICCLSKEHDASALSSSSALKIMAPHLHNVITLNYRKELISQTSENPLSSRELEILQWVSQGKTNYEIGIILSISAYTVKNHISNILSKLQVSNRAQALEKCMTLGYFWR